MLTRKSQIWVETVIYTAIGLTIIGILLYTSIPVINKYKDEIVVEQTLTLMSQLNQKVIEVKTSGLGNKRIVPELTIKKGRLDIDYTADTITYYLQGTLLEYSELGEEVPSGDVFVKTQKSPTNEDVYDITMTLKYSAMDIDLISEADSKISLTKSPTPYKLSIENSGEDVGSGKIKIKIASEI
jgi:hypothetical protein